MQSWATSWGLHSFLARDFTVNTHLFRDQFLFCLPALCMCYGMISSIYTTVTFLLLVFGRPASEKERVGQITGASEPDRRGGGLRDGNPISS